MHALAERIKREFPDGFVDAVEWRGDLAVTVRPAAVHAVARFLRHDPEIDCDYMVHVSSVDWPDDEERFEVVWEVASIRKRHRIRLKTRVSEAECQVDSLTDVWHGANFMEREVYDMMGIRFRNHPDLRRILMPDDYTEGYPLRKDFPLQGKGWRDTFEFLNEKA
ncbi:MAG: NADH-quinone oxidoreductase subunit C [Nitrospirota bacterium]